MRLLTSTAVRLGLGTMKSLPIVGAVADAVDAESAVEQAERFRTYLAGKFPNQDVRLLLLPTEMLTPSFLAGLRRLAAKRPVALFFDTFERTALWCETWLLDLFGGRYGALPANLVVGVAGQHPLDPNRWSGYAGILAEIELAPFTEEEARGLCLRKGVRDERVIRLILGLSGRLPLLVAMLAQNQPGDPAEVGDPSDDAVERFLKWESDEERRAVALLAAYPRTLNEDVLGALVSPQTAGATFAWLRGQPFVSRRAGGYVYHAAVRTPMLRTQRSRSPLDWRRRHRSLRERHQQWRDELQLPESQQWNDPAWQHHLLEEIYHGLCADPHAHLDTALEQVVHAHRTDIALTRRVLDAVRQAGEEVESELLLSWAARLGAHAGGSNESSVELMTILLETVPLSARAQADALYTRAWACLSLKRFETALADLDRAVELEPGYAWGVALRGGIHHLAGRNDQALADLDRVVGLDPRFAGAIAVRGTVHRVMGNHEQALADLDRAIELDPDYAWALAARGTTYQALRRYDEALIDLDHALGLDPGYAWALAARGETHRILGDHGKALADLDRAMELDPAASWHVYASGLTRLSLGDRAAADEAFRRALDLGAREVAGGDTDGNARLNLGVYLAALGDHTEASKIFGSETRPGCVIEGVVHALRTLRDLLPGQAEEIDALIRTLREVT